MRKKVSIKDVADALGVSKTLVSFVLNNKTEKHGINAETRQRVLDKIKEMNYSPNQAARGLRTGKSNAVGLIIADIANPFYSRIARSIEDQARKKGYQLLICSSDEIAEREIELIQLLSDTGQVEGIIISTTQSDAKMLGAIYKDNFPIVLIDRYFEESGIPTVIVNNEEGAYSAVEKLITNGMKRIGMLTISPSFISSVRDRVKGYKKALKENNMKFDKKLLREIPFDNLRDSVRKEVMELLSPPNKADAIFLANNNLAVAAIEVINEMGLRIPNDVALVSFDDIELFQLTQPGITAVSQPIEQMGKEAFYMLERQINGEEENKPGRVVLETELKVRRSCGSVMKP
jgi:LacI family transcriptional regulator